LARIWHPALAEAEQSMRSIAMSLLALSLTSCVSAAKHEQLEQKYARSQAELSAARRDYHSLAQALEAQKGLAADLGHQQSALKSELANRERKLAEVEAVVAAQKEDGTRLSNELADLVKDRSRLKESTDRLRQALADLAARKLVAERRVAEYQSMLARFKQLIDAGTLQVRILDGRMVLTLASDVLFASGSAKLSTIGKAAVVDIASVLAGLKGRRIQIEGHTDNVPIHNQSYASNWELAAARAFTVLRTMTENGVAADALSAASYGEYHPRASNDDEIGRTVNRRIEIVLPPDLSTLPGAEELEHVIAQP
jgi:chemotaxis protein MotB